MTCVSFEGRYRRHLFTIREAGKTVKRFDHCLRCGAPRRPPEAKADEGQRKRGRRDTR